MQRAYYSDSISNFLTKSTDEIIGQLTREHPFNLEISQRSAWEGQIEILKETLQLYNGVIYFEFSIPRMGKRVDVVLLISSVIYVLEFKVGEKKYASHSIDQVVDYALDLKHFHETSHGEYVAPVLVATDAPTQKNYITLTHHNDKVFAPILTNASDLRNILAQVLVLAEGSEIKYDVWSEGRYSPTPTIMEAALALYNKHSVEDISRNDAGATNLSNTSTAISKIIETAQKESKKAICFVTGVPGSGKTLVGLDVANQHTQQADQLYSVFLSGNGPLVAVLQEALARDTVAQAKKNGEKLKKGDAVSKVKAFIQNVHHFRDECIRDSARPPIEHVALFDEAQRAWNKKQTANFMQRKKNLPGFNQSEPEFLISCLDRHQDWAVIVCLVGGGQEINTGEAGIKEWMDALLQRYPHWDIYISPNLAEDEYQAREVLEKMASSPRIQYTADLHLSVSLRSFRSENVSNLVKQVLDKNPTEARALLDKVKPDYPIYLTRDLGQAKTWLREQARGTERYGVVVSSAAERLKPHAINVKAPMNTIHWFLGDKSDVRSSYYLEDVATEFHIQGLELDWACLVWDADFRFSKNGWVQKEFRGNRWVNINHEERRAFQKNAYRVLLTRARQGMVIVVPEGTVEDHTRLPEFYDPTFDYLSGIGFKKLK